MTVRVSVLSFSQLNGVTLTRILHQQSHHTPKRIHYHTDRIHLCPVERGASSGKARNTVFERLNNKTMMLSSGHIQHVPSSLQHLASWPMPPISYTRVLLTAGIWKNHRTPHARLYTHNSHGSFSHGWLT